jgi:hypothetical protein
MKNFTSALVALVATVYGQDLPDVKVADFTESTFMNKVDHFNF